MANSLFVETALLQGLKGTMRAQYGAVLVHRGKIISTGYNKMKSTKYGSSDDKKKSCLL